MADVASIIAHEKEPITALNDPFLSRIDYRADDYSSLRFKLLKHIAETFGEWNPELQKNQGEQDMAVAFAELFAYLGDIIGFYQDCRANEAFIRTATLQQSLIHICGLIDYRVAPGAAASTLQAFLLAKGKSGTIPAGFKVKTEAKGSTPAMVFETGRRIAADAARNTLYLAGYNRSSLRINAPGMAQQTTALLDQGYAGLKAGSFVVAQVPGTASYPLQLTAVVAESSKRRIYWEPGAIPVGANLPVADLVLWGKPKQKMALAAKARADEITAGQTTMLVGNATMLKVGRPVLITSQGLMLPARVESRDTTSHLIVLNRGFNVSLRRSETRVYRSTSVGATNRSLRRGATKVVRLSVYKGGGSTPSPQPGDQLLIVDGLGVEKVVVARVSGNTFYLADPLPRAFHPAPHSFDSAERVRFFKVRLPSEGLTGSFSAWTRVRSVRLASLPNVYSGGKTRLVLDTAYEGLKPGTPVVISDGNTHRVHTVYDARVDGEATVLRLNGTVAGNLKVADTTIFGPFEQQMHIDGYNRAEGSTVANATTITIHGVVTGLKPADYLAIAGGGHAEGVRITALQRTGGNTLVSLQQKLKYAYPLATTKVYGNVAPVSHGETVVEQVLGSGDHSQAGQTFALRRSPVTHVHDAEGWRGISNTLEVFVGGELWQEVQSLAESGPDDRHYMVEIDGDEKMSFQFGDGHHGARLTTGRDNVKVRYRVDLGANGNVAAGAIKKMPQALPFLESTLNPIPAAGGQDRETPELIRRNAPATVRTLDRAVSLSDYADLAITYAGIAKARADWFTQEGQRVIRLTVAAVDGVALSPTLKEALRAYLDARRSPHHRLHIRDHRRFPVRLAVQVQVKPTFLKMEAKERVERALGSGLTEDGKRGYFHFDRLELGQDLYLSDVYALIEAVRGIDHVLAVAFHPEEPTPTTVLLDRIQVPAGAVASGGDPSNPAVGILSVVAKGGIV